MTLNIEMVGNGHEFYNDGSVAKLTDINVALIDRARAEYAKSDPFKGNKYLTKKFTKQKILKKEVEGELIIADFPQLKKIEINRGNGIAHLSILNCPQIEKIRIWGVGLQSIEAKQLLEKLEVLDLRNNSLNYIPPEFLPLNLKELDIYENQFTILPENINDRIEKFEREKKENRRLHPTWQQLDNTKKGRNEIERRIKEFSQIISQLEEEKQKLNEKISELKPRVSNNEEKLNVLKKEKEQLEKNLEHEEELINLNENLEVRESKLRQNFEEQRNKLVEEIKNLREFQNKLSESEEGKYPNLVSLVRLCVLNIQEFIEQEKIFQVQMKQIEKLKSEIETKNNEIKEFKTTIDSKNSKIIEIIKLQEKIAELVDQNTQKEVLEAQEIQLRGRNLELAEKVFDLGQELEELEQNKDNLEQTNKNLDQENTKLAIEKRNQQEIIVQLEESLIIERTKNTTLEEIIKAKSNKKLEEVEKVNIQLIEKVGLLSQRLQEKKQSSPIEEEKKVIRERKLELEQSINDTKNKLEQLEKAKRKLSQRLTESEIKTFLVKQDEVNELEEKIKQLDETQKLISQLEKQREEMESELQLEAKIINMPVGDYKSVPKAKKTEKSKNSDY
ncbi:6678_t:CDS:10 [Funneliformis geosporum]|uniref:6678_t:CDS:1 n=1 Tax=Funneliformis geosporum TaxID=1117311 RepID=A0A9W4T2B1_9GLOM|nr:6678_t:CDS:10 [Funneliformis geosporum]